MNLKHLFIVLIVALTSWLCLGKKLQGWAQQDLAYCYQTLQNDHPGMYNLKDPDFKKNLKKFYQQSLERLGRAQSDEEKMNIIEGFGKLFNDIHLSARYFRNKNIVKQKSITKTDTQNDFNIEVLSDNTFWVHLPTFGVRTMAGESKKVDAINKIIKQMQSLRLANKIIFDVRGNGGGDSAWGSKIIKALFGDAYRNFYCSLANKNLYTDWRASEDNLNHIRQLQQQTTDTFGKKSNETKFISSVVDGMQKAIKNHQRYYRSPEKTTSKKEPEPNLAPEPNLINTEIIIIIDKGCGSSCLNFIGELKAMKYPIFLIGKTTNADTLYMDIRMMSLPSKKGTFRFPIKVIRNRLRGNNEPYKPDLFNDLTDENTLRKIILHH